MAAYTDRNGTKHTVCLDVFTAQLLRDECGVDLLACLTDRNAVASLEKIISGLAADPITVISWLAVIEDVPESDATTFGRLFDGETLNQAAGAIIEAIIDFFPEPQRTILQRLMEKTDQQFHNLRVTATAEMLQQIETLDLNSVLNESLIPGNGSTESSDSLDTTAAD